MTPSSPPTLLSVGDIAEFLGVRPRQLTWWIYALREDRRYTQFQILKRDGSPRIIRAPIKPIKDMHRTLARALLDHYRPAVSVHGFAQGRSPLSNARRHERQKWLLRLDLEDFFPSINFGRVRGLFMEYPFHYAPNVATILAQLCCFRNELPQGAPTSPIVSNLICRGMDSDLGALARGYRCFYTRYADDICVSTDQATLPKDLAERLPNGLTVVSARLSDTITEHGFRVNRHKTRLVRYSQRQRVTGLVVNEGANVPREYVRSLRTLLYIWRRHGEQVALEAFQKAHPAVNWPPGKPAPSFRRVVGGRVQYVGSVKGWDSDVYRQLAQRLGELDDSFNPRTLNTLHAAQSVQMYVEGESDVKHLRAAANWFREQGEFLNLDLRFGSDSVAGSDAQLFEKCKGLAMTPQTLPCICVFDRDSRTAATAVGSTGFRAYRNKVAAVATVPPEWRDPNDPICIELLYRPEELAQACDENGRRIFLREEFDDRTGHGHHGSEPVSTPNIQKTTLVREDVHRFSDRANVALSKSAFADYVEDRHPSFDALSFEGFRPTFQLIEQAVARVQ